MDFFTATLKYLGKTNTFNPSKSNEQVAAIIDLGILAVSDAFLILNFLSYFNSPYISERIIFTSKFTGDIFKALIYSYTAGDKPSISVWTSLAAVLSIISDIAQYKNMISEPS